MARLLIILGSLLLPLLVYLLWLGLSRRKLELKAAGRLSWWMALPWTWLIVAGIATLGVTLITLRLLEVDIDSLLPSGDEELLHPRREP